MARKINVGLQINQPIRRAYLNLLLQNIYLVLLLQELLLLPCNLTGKRREEKKKQNCCCFWSLDSESLKTVRESDKNKEMTKHDKGMVDEKYTRWQPETKQNFKTDKADIDK